MQTIGVNIVPGNFPQFIRYSQNDIGREFKINVVDFEIPSGATVECVATKPSGLGFTVSGTVTDNTVTFVTTAIMTDEWGKFPAELRISSGGVLLGTANFMFIGERNPHPEGTTDGQQGTIIPELTLLVNEIRESNARVAEMTASAHASAEPTAEYDADTNNLEFGIPSITEEEFLKAFVTDSASGSIASITDGADGLPIKSLNVNIAPKQSGTGDPSPSNVRPITGWDEVEVYVRGVNFFDNTTFVKGRLDNGVIGYADGTTSFTVTDSGVIFTTNAEYRGVVGGKTKVVPNIDYCLSFERPSTSISIFVDAYDSNDNWIGRLTASSTSGSTSLRPIYTIHTPTNCDYVRVSLQYWATGTIEVSNIILNYPSTDHEYHPYQGTSYPISLPSTVYGGTLNVTTGELTINRKIYTSTWGAMRVIGSSDGYTRKELSITNDCYNLADGLNKTISNIGNYAYNNTWNTHFYLGNGNAYVFLPDSTDSTQAIQLVGTLKEPTTVTLDPTEVNTLLGNNNIWSDAGSVEVEYRADTKLYIDKLLGNTRTLSMAPAPETTEETEDDQR